MSDMSFAFRLAHQQLATVIAVHGADVRLIVSELRDIAHIHCMAGDLDAAELLHASAARLELAHGLTVRKQIV